MKISETELKDVVVIEPDLFEDDRGYFYESHNIKEFEKNGLPTNFVQDNQSMSKKGVLRGLHFQKPPYAQGKLVRVVKGKVLDVVVDIRKNSSTYGKWFSIELSEENKKMLWVPEGFAHGFFVLEEGSVFQYKCTNYYNKEADAGIKWNDSSINIDWQLEKYGIDEPAVSEKDKQLPFLKDLGEVF